MDVYILHRFNLNMTFSAALLLMLLMLINSPQMVDTLCHRVEYEVYYG